MTTFFRDFPERRLPWQVSAGPEADVVLATSAALARNLRAFPFPGRASEVELRTIRGDLTRRLGSLEPFADGWHLDLEGLTTSERRCLQEMTQLSARSAADPVGKGLVLDGGLGLCLAFNGDDHLEAVATRAGWDPRSALDDVLELDALFEQQVDFAFDADLGYLTAYPTRVGTGLRLSAALHLPGLVMADEIQKLINALRQLQFTIHGFHGPGTPIRGALFRVENLITLGRSEAEVQEDFATHVGKIIAYERSARRQLFGRDSLGLEDVVRRSLAILQEARLMSSQEAFDRLSDVRLGLSLGILEGISTETLNLALVRQQSAHLDRLAGKGLHGKDRLAARARHLREWLGTA
ncbi:MAG: hypothetical protein AB7V45_12340 [Candidatus Krumholzibacteriia bacterium]